MSAAYRVLIVEDDNDLAEMLEIYFEAYDYEIFLAQDGAEGLALARRHLPSVIILDIDLPDMDGFTICQHLHDMSLTKHIPVIFLTERSERDKRMQGLSLSVDDYITKPFDIDELRLRIKRSFDRMERLRQRDTLTGFLNISMLATELTEFPLAASYRVEPLYLNIFSDMYGFMARDELLQFIARIIRENMDDMKQTYLVGVLNSVFTILLGGENDGELVFERIQQNFLQQIGTFYSFEDATRGGMLINDRYVPMVELDVAPIPEVITEYFKQFQEPSA